LAHLVARNGHEVRLWTRDAAEADKLSVDHENLKYLPGVSLQDIAVSAAFEPTLAGADWVVCAVPCAGVPDLARGIREFVGPGIRVISGTKGLHPGTGNRPSQMWAQEMGLEPAGFAALSGPNLAREIISGVPTSSVAASTVEETASATQALFNSRKFRVYTNTDLVGVELGGALKNVVAIVAGITDGLGFGDNAKAAIMTRHWAEMTRLAVALGARQSTLFGLSGIGDLFATCASSQSRNHSLGRKIASGETLSQAQEEVMQVAEGVHTTRAALHLAATAGLEMPVTEQLAAVLFKGVDARQSVEELMGRQECAE
jgi:glycerol-3-phosphate dehydrogenase (NAD(P)+)